MSVRRRKAPTGALAPVGIRRGTLGFILPPLTELSRAALAPTCRPPDGELDVDTPAGAVLRGTALLLLSRLSGKGCLTTPPVVRNDYLLPDGVLPADLLPDNCANKGCTEVYTMDALRADSSLTRVNWASRWRVPDRDAEMRVADGPANSQFYRDFFKQPFWGAGEGDTPEAELRAVGYVVVVASKGENGKIDMLHPGHVAVVVEDPTMDADFSVADTEQRDVWSIGFFPTGDKTASTRGQFGELNFPDPMLKSWVADRNAAADARALGGNPVSIVAAFQLTPQDVTFFREIVAAAETAASVAGDEIGYEYPSRLKLPKTRWAMFAGVMDSLQRGLAALGLQDPMENCATMFASRFGVNCPHGAPFLCESSSRSGFGDTFSELLLSTEQQANDPVVKDKLLKARQALDIAFDKMHGLW